MMPLITPRTNHNLLLLRTCTIRTMSSSTTTLLRGTDGRSCDTNYYYYNHHHNRHRRFGSWMHCSKSASSHHPLLSSSMIPFPHQKTWLFSTDATESSSSNTPAVGTASSSPRSSSMIQLYQYAICPFCNRVKALLDYAGMKYQTIEVNPLTKAEIRPFGYTKVPILTIAPVAAQNHEDEDDVQPIMDSAKIVQGLLEMEEVQTQLHTLRWNDSDWNLEKFQNGPRTQFVIDLAVNDLAAVLYPNMCRSFADSYRAFHYVHSVPSFAPIQRILIQTIGSVAMYMAATRVKKKRNITDERQALDEILGKLESELLTPPPPSSSSSSCMYLSRDSHPDLGDITVYGILRSIEHLPVFDALIRQRGGPLVEWYDRIRHEMKPPSSSS